MTNPVFLHTPKRFRDNRGWFAESFNASHIAKHGTDRAFVQDNHSFSAPKHTLRGIHFQGPPHAQDKLVRCIRGRIFDIAVDLRSGSPTYGRWVGAELSEENGAQLFVPVGFGHAFLTLEEDCEVLYKVTDYYDAPSDGGVAWNDPTIAVAWPEIGGADFTLSEKDSGLPTLDDFISPFQYDGRPLQALGPDHFGSL